MKMLLSLLLVAITTTLNAIVVAAWSSNGQRKQQLFRRGKNTALEAHYGSIPYRRLDDVNGAHHDHDGKPDRYSMDKDISNIFENNRRWINQKKFEDPDYFEKLGSGHRPTYMWIGCADARVPANEIMGEDAGSVFVVRNVANLVVGTDFNLMAALQFGVETLKIPHILVCGHYDCGGVRASMEKLDHVPPLENWLRNIRDVYRLHRLELDAIKDPEQRHRRLVELNVIEQCINLFKTGAIQRRRVETYRKGKKYTTPRVHACVFDPATGEMNSLKVNFKQYINELHEIYDLYTPEDVINEVKPHAPQPLGKGNAYLNDLSSN